MACVCSTTTAANNSLSLESTFFISSTTGATSPSSPTSTLFLSHAFPLSSSLSLTALAPHASLRPVSCFASIRPRRQERKQQLQLCRAATEYVFPDPIPEFADSETNKFRNHLLEKLSKKAVFGDSVKEVVAICTEILSTFLHTEYGGPGTLLVIPFIDMADTINERELPGGPQAARAAVVWAQKHVDNDWKEWTGKND